MFRNINWDGLGVTTSVICAIHCALLPLLFSSMPLLGIDLLKEKIFEYSMIGIAFLIGVIAMSHGYRRHHHRWMPIALFTVGFFFLVSKEWTSRLEIPFLGIAVLLILSAHFLNFRLCRGHNHAHSTDCDH